MSDFITKDSGQREEFQTGSRRDTQRGKPRYDLIPICALKRVADLYARGAEKYGDNNWQLGQPFRRTYSSLLRHLFQWAEGDREEDHLAACCWATLSLMYYENKILSGELAKDLDDLGVLRNEKL